MPTPVAERYADAGGAPPLFSWALALLFVALIAGGLWTWTYWGTWSKGPLYSAHDCAAALVAEGPPADNEVIALGDSLLGAATEPAKDFEEKLPGLRWRMCPISAGTWPELAAGLPAIAARHPRLLVLHEGILQKTDASPPDPIRMLYAALLVKLRARAQLPEQAGLGCAANQPMSARDYRPLLEVQPAVLAEARRLIHGIVASGVPVVVLDIPRSEALETELGAVLSRRREALRQLAADSGAQYWTFDAVSGQNAYCGDLAHLDLAGRKRLQPQLAARLQASVQASPP